MRFEHLKQAEMFVFLAMLFLIGVAFLRADLHAADTAREDAETRAAAFEHDADQAREDAQRAWHAAHAATAKAREAERQNPPIIILSEDDEAYRFALGSAALSSAFAARLETEIVPQLARWSEIYACDTLEVVGHTDEAFVQRGRSNLDRQLLRRLEGRADAAPTLAPGSNVDLGMMRAVAITERLLAARAAGTLAGIRFFHPLSAGQLILPDRTLAAPQPDAAARVDASRRRIEIRLLRSESRRLDGAASRGSPSTSSRAASRTRATASARAAFPLPSSPAPISAHPPS